MSGKKFNSQETVTCSKCGYDANPIGVKFCQNCNQPLEFTSSSIGDKVIRLDLIPYLFLGLLFLIFSSFAVFGFYYGKEFRSLIPNRDENISSKNSSLNSSSGIKYYNYFKEVLNVPEGTFNFGGSLIFASLVTQGTHQAINKAYPKFLLRYTEPVDNQPGTNKGIEMLLRGELSFALSGRPLEDTEYKIAAERGFHLEQVPVAIDGIACYTHPNISITGLSVAQLQAIYTGKITNWKQVGGSDLPIVPFSINTKTTALLKTLLDSKIGNVSPNVHSSRDYTELVRDVASTPGAIGIGAAMLVATQSAVHPVTLARGDSTQYIPVVTEDHRLNLAAFRDGTYPITRYFYVIIRRDGRANEQAGVAYANLLLSKEGQQFVEKAGLVPIR